MCVNDSIMCVNDSIIEGLGVTFGLFSLVSDYDGYIGLVSSVRAVWVLQDALVSTAPSKTCY